MNFEFHPNDTVEERIARYIVEKHFTLKKCQRYVKHSYDKNKALLKEDDCACGRSKTWHLRHHAYNKANTIQGEAKWSVQKDTVPYPCDTFGELAFRAGYGVDQTEIVPGARAKYIRLEGKAPRIEQYFESIYQLMTHPNLWALPAPQLIIEVTGSAEPLPHVDQRAIERFNSGLIAAAKSAKAWLVTGGTNCGVMKLCGEAVTTARMTNEGKIIPCIGISSWGIINRREALVGYDDTAQHSGSRSPNLNEERTNSNEQHLPPINNAQLDMPASGTRHRTTSENSYSPDFVGRWPADYVVEKREANGDEPYLDPGHAAFIFVDNGREKLFGEEIEFRAQFLNFLSKKGVESREKMENGLPQWRIGRTPLVLLVIGGGRNTLLTVKISTAKDDKDDKDEEWWPRPVVILPGFGGAADVLGFAYAITAPAEDHDARLYRHSAVGAVFSEHDEKNVFPHDFDERVARHPAFSSLLPKASQKQPKPEDVKSILDSIKACLQRRSFITVVDLFEDESDEKQRVGLDQAILNAIFKSDLKLDPPTMFQLAQQWRRCDVAKRQFKRHAARIRKEVDLNLAMTRAIEVGDEAFFNFFIDYGLIDLRTYLTFNQMRTLYEDLFIRRIGKAAKTSCIQLFRSLLMNSTSEDTLSDLQNVHFMDNVGTVLARLMRCYMDNTFTGERNFTSSSKKGIHFIPAGMITGDDLAGRALAAVTGDDSYLMSTRRGSLGSSNLSNDDNDEDAIEQRKRKQPYDTSERDLLILLLLLHRQEMAIKVWQRGHDHVGSALMASIFMKSLAKEAERLDMMDLGSDYEECAAIWQDRAIALLDYCYEQDPLKCNRLLSRSLLMWQGLTVLEMAYYGKKKRIMEHDSIQTKMNQIWLGRMATFTLPSLIYISALPPFTFIFIYRIRFEEMPVFHRDSTGGEIGNQTTTGGLLAISAKITNRYSQFSEQDETSRCGGRSCFGRIAPSEIMNTATSISGTTNQIGDNKTPSPLSPQSRPNYNDKKLLKAKLFGGDGGQKDDTISVTKAIYFLYASPIVKYVTHSLTLITFLMLFSSFILVGPNPNRVTPVEIVIWATCLIYYLDLLRESFAKQNLRFTERFFDFASDAWNLIDTATIALLIAAVVQRFTLPEPRDFVYPRTTYSVACVIYWLKSLHIFYVTKTIGPKVAGMFKMLWDVAFFLLIYIIILLAFSIPIHSLMYPEAKIETAEDFLAILVDVAYRRMWNLFITVMDDSRRLVDGTCRPAAPISLLNDMVFYPYNDDNSSNMSIATPLGNNNNNNNISLWEMLTTATPSNQTTSAFTMFNDSITVNETNATTNGSSMLLDYGYDYNGNNGEQWFETCTTRNVIGIILYIIYLILTNIVLVNMLIAMFAHTVAKSSESAERMWRYNMYRFVREYYKKPVLPGPLMVFELVYRIFVLMISRQKRRRLHLNNEFKEHYDSLDDYEYRKLEMFERSAVQLLIHEGINAAKKGGHQIMVSKLRNVHEKINGKMDHIEAKLSEFRNEMVASSVVKKND